MAYESIEKRPLGKVLKPYQQKGVKKQLAAVGDKLLDDLKAERKAKPKKSKASTS